MRGQRCLLFPLFLYSLIFIAQVFAQTFTVNGIVSVSTTKAAYNMGVTIMASPWSPPASMKTNNSTVGGGLKDGSYADFAAHLKSFADYMAGNGVPIHSISVQNEPDVTVTYESCDYSADGMLKFMKENAPAVGIPVCAPESFHFDKSMSGPLVNDSVATANTAYICAHIYGGGLEPYPLAVEKGKEVWMTEHIVLETDWNAVLATGKEINVESVLPYTTTNTKNCMAGSAVPVND